MTVTHSRLPGARGAAVRLVACAVAVLLAGLPIASARADLRLPRNQTLIDAIRQTSIQLVTGPPEVAREMAIVDGAMFNAVNAATGQQYQPFLSSIGPASGANEDAAALGAGYAAMLAIFSPVGTAGNPNTNPQTIGNLWSAPVSSVVTADINAAYNAALASLNTSDPSVQKRLALGEQEAANMVAQRSNDGWYQAIVSGLNTYVPPNEGQPGVYVPPTSRPAMLPAWGTVAPMGISPATVAAVVELGARPAGAELPGLCQRAAGDGMRGLHAQLASARQVAIACAAAGFGTRPRRRPRPRCSGTIPAPRCSRPATGCRSPIRP